jgi:hypothetical protein
MSVPPDKLLSVLAMAQLTTVAPALEGSYAGGGASTIGLALLVLAQDVATRDARRQRSGEAAAMLLAGAGHVVPDGHDERLQALDDLLASTDDRDLERRILDLYVEMTEAAFVAPPVLPT